jgi:flavin reductase (DIM6/NTAB) family NADH-FMN oxidoreductase RutF
MATATPRARALARGAPAAARLRELPLSEVYQLVEPGPVVLLVTSARGRPNVMPMSWHLMLEFEPPLVGCVVSDRNHSFAALSRTRECVLAIPSVEIARKVARCGDVSGRDVDKLAAFGLTALPASEVAPPLVAECWADLECRVVDARNVARYGLFVLEVVKAWIRPAAARRRPRTLHHVGYERFVVSGETIRLPTRAR